MINVSVRGFVEEGEMLSAIQSHLGITYNEVETMYIELGGFDGHPVAFSTQWSKDDPFSVAVQEFMTANNIQSLDVGYRN